MRTKFMVCYFCVYTILKEYALDTLGKLEKFYDGIISAEVILSFEKSRASVKVAEVNLSVHSKTLTAMEETDDFAKSIDLAVEKLERQLVKYKTKLHDRKSPSPESYPEVQEEQ